MTADTHFRWIAMFHIDKNKSGCPLQIRQLFKNLLGNAMKYRRSEERPIIRISACKLGNGFVEIQVKDNGIGFDMESIDKIFRPFQRLNADDGRGVMGLAWQFAKKSSPDTAAASPRRANPVRAQFFCSRCVRPEGGICLRTQEEILRSIHQTIDEIRMVEVAGIELRL